MPDENKRDILYRIRKAMIVFDSEGDELGKVTDIYLGEPDEEEVEQSRYVNPVRDGLSDMIVRALIPNANFPEEMEQRLYREGFIRINEGLLSKDLYILPDQIDILQGSHIHLNVPEEALLRR